MAFSSIFYIIISENFRISTYFFMKKNIENAIDYGLIEYCETSTLLISVGVLMLFLLISRFFLIKIKREIQKRNTL